MENDGVRIWLEKNGLIVGDNINVNQNIGTRHLAKAAMDKRFVSFLKWKYSFWLLEI